MRIRGITKAKLNKASDEKLQELAEEHLGEIEDEEDEELEEDEDEVPDLESMDDKELIALAKKLKLGKGRMTADKAFDLLDEHFAEGEEDEELEDEDEELEEDEDEVPDLEEMSEKEVIALAKKLGLVKGRKVSYDDAYDALEEHFEGEIDEDEDELEDDEDDWEDDN